MKKIISVVLACLVVCLFAAPSCTLAAGTPTFEVSSATAKPGESFKIKISIKDNPGIASAKFKVTFDDDLTLDKVNFGDKLGGMTQTSPTLASPATLNWVSPTEDLKEDTVYATLSFTASKNAGNGEHKIEISYDPADVFNISTKTIDFNVKNGVVTVTGGSSSSAAKSTSSALSDDTESIIADAADTGSMDENGDYVGGEEIIEFEDEDGAEVANETATTGEKKATPIWVFAVIAALLIAAGVAVVIVKKKADKKTAQ